MTVHEPGRPISAELSHPHPAQLVVSTDTSGAIVAGSDRWPGAGAYRARTLGELVHERNHDLLERIVRELGDRGRLDHGVGVQIRGADGWAQAVVTAAADGGTVQWQFVPVLPDPLRGVVAAVTSGRDITLALSAAVDVLPNEDLWLSVHYSVDRDDRFDSMVASEGRDTFRRAVEALVVAEDRCPWDADLVDGPEDLPVEAFSDGLTLAGPHAGIGSCRLVPIPSLGKGNAGCLAVWSEGAARLDLPENHLVEQRVKAALGLVFQHAETMAGQRQLEQQDRLTGLRDRQTFLSDLNGLRGDQSCAVLIIDIDDFRAVNEWHGYAVGDLVLSEFADRLSEAMRPGDVIARVSGDEFAVLCREVADDRGVEAISGRVMAICHEPFRSVGSHIELSVSAGAAIARDGRGGSQLFEAAERAMLEAKSDAKGSWRMS
ncbi:MAG: diguanylate cyclase domain-containing protein [Acidimicrobiales bacterium]